MQLRERNSMGGWCFLYLHVTIIKILWGWKLWAHKCEQLLSSKKGRFPWDTPTSVAIEKYGCVSAEVQVIENLGVLQSPTPQAPPCFGWSPSCRKFGVTSAPPPHPKHPLVYGHEGRNWYYPRTLTTSQMVIIVHLLPNAILYYSWTRQDLGKVTFICNLIKV